MTKPVALLALFAVALPPAASACSKKEKPAPSAAAEPAAPAAGNADAWFVCPMTEDNVWQHGPGRCPKCGMNLERAPEGWTPPPAAGNCTGDACGTGAPAGSVPGASEREDGAGTARGAAEAPPAPAERTAKELAADRLGRQAICPVTGETFTVSDLTPAVSYQGTVYLFCCAACAPRFLAEPQRFGAPAPAGG